MKKGICILLMLLVCSPVLSNDRVNELKIEGEKLQKQLVQLNQARQNTQIRLIQINAILGELQREVEEDAICELPSKTE